MNYVYCPICNTQVDFYANYCPVCGHCLTLNFDDEPVLEWEDNTIEKLDTNSTPTNAELRDKLNEAIRRLNDEI